MWGVEARPDETVDAALARAVAAFDVDAFLDPSSGTQRSSKVVKKVSDVLVTVSVTVFHTAMF